MPNATIFKPATLIGGEDRFTNNIAQMGKKCALPRQLRSPVPSTLAPAMESFCGPWHALSCVILAGWDTLVKPVWLLTAHMGAACQLYKDSNYLSLLLGGRTDMCGVPQLLPANRNPISLASMRGWKQCVSVRWRTAC